MQRLAWRLMPCSPPCQAVSPCHGQNQWAGNQDKMSAVATNMRSLGRLCTQSAQVVVVSAMGSHPSSPVKVTDLLLNMVAKAQRQDEAFLLDLAALQVGLLLSTRSRS